MIVFNTMIGMLIILTFLNTIRLYIIRDKNKSYIKEFSGWFLDTLVCINFISTMIIINLIF